jgi:CRP/FNR family transcriptional regulator
MEEVTFRPIERRLAGYLLARATGDGIIQATHQEISVELGTAREVVSRHLKRLEAAGLVELGRSTIGLRDRAGLQRLADTPV